MMQEYRTPFSVELWDSSLLRAQPEASRKREDAKARGIADLKKREESEAAKIVQANKSLS